MAVHSSNETGSAAITAPRHIVSGDQKNQRKSKIYTRVVTKTPTGVVKQRREKSTVLSEPARLRIQEEVTNGADADENEVNGDPNPLPVVDPNSRFGDLSRRLDVNLLLNSSVGGVWNREPRARYYASNTGPIPMVNIPGPDAEIPKVTPSRPTTHFNTGTYHQRSAPTYTSPKKASAAPAAPAKLAGNPKDDRAIKFVQNAKLRAIFSGRRFPQPKKSKGMKLK